MIHGPLVKHLSGPNKKAASSSRSKSNIATATPETAEKIQKQSEQSNLDVMEGLFIGIFWGILGPLQVTLLIFYFALQ